MPLWASEQPDSSADRIDYALALHDAHGRETLDISCRPAHFHDVGLVRRPQSEVQAQVVLRVVARAG